MDSLAPADIHDIAEIVREGRTLEIIGLGSKRGLGRPITADTRLSTRRMTGIRFYEPDEMVLSAMAGTPLSEIQALLAAQHQQLAFAPPCWNALLAPHQTDQTIGGIVACNLSGSQRLSDGAARDHLLGFQGVNGRGEIFKSGGRVVKNVTGYDLSKLMAGSFGTLAILSEVTLRTLPLAEFEATLVLHIADAGEAVRCFSRLMAGPFDLSAAAWVPDSIAQRLELQGSTALLQLTGHEVSVRERIKRITESQSYTWQILENSASSTLWQRLGDAQPLAHRRDTAIWRISVPPASGADILQRLPTGDAWLDWAGGLIWLAVPDEQADPALANAVRGIINANGGHATLVRASEATRQTVNVFQPRTHVHAALAASIKAAFDPDSLLNPGRMN